MCPWAVAVRFRTEGPTWSWRPAEDRTFPDRGRPGTPRAGEFGIPFEIARVEAMVEPPAEVRLRRREQTRPCRASSGCSPAAWLQTLL